MCILQRASVSTSLFHRNRCVQVRRGTDLDVIYHVATDFNPADIGTRPQLVKITDVGPNSAWEKGLPWMNGEIDDALDQGILTPASKLRLTDEEENLYKKGFVFEKSPEILTKGHAVMLVNARVEKVKERQEFSNYLIPPNKFKFEKFVRVLSIVKKFLQKCSKGKLFKKENTRFQMFPVLNMMITVQRSKLSYLILIKVKPAIMHYYLSKNLYSVGVKKPGIQFKGEHYVELDDDDISWALEYLFQKGSEEVKKFCSPDFVKKIAIEKNKILFLKNRILDVERFKAAGGLENLDPVSEFGIKAMIPVFERFSPLSYSIGDYVHRNLAKHAGYENCLRESLNHCFIIQGLSLFRELGEDCVRCLKKRKAYLDIPEGLVPEENLTIAPPFWVAMCDLYGPCHIFVPGHAHKTRHRNVVEAKCYVLVTVCPVTKMVNLQVIESKSADGILDGITRLACEVGVPTLMLVDQDSGVLKALREAECDVKNLDLKVHKEKGMRFKTCPVSGHNYHGLVEVKIRTVQECLDKCDLSKLRLHATGLQTLCKLVENDMNNLPMGFSYARDANNSPLLKLIFPNMLRIGRMNSRSLDGPIKLPSGPQDLMEKVEKAYTVFYKLWNITMVPRLMRMHKWFDGKAQLKVGDIIYFRKVESELSSKWTFGKITEVVKGRDENVRRATVQYQNFNENHSRYTDRAARSLIKLFNIDDKNWQEDMDLVEKLIEETKVKKKDSEHEDID